MYAAVERVALNRYQNRDAQASTRARHSSPDRTAASQLPFRAAPVSR